MNKTWVKWFLALLSDAGYQEGERVVVGVSGGPDSLVLLHLLRDLLGHDVLHVAHLDHAIRPASSIEEKFVADLAGSWDIPSSTRRIDVPEVVKRQGLSLEEAARIARYKFLADVAQKVGAKIVTVGHNSDDQAETILLHFLRGSGLNGLRGMLPLSPFPGVQGLLLMRPLLNLSRAEIEAYYHQHDLKPLLDESNSDPAFLRNRIRLQLLPELEAYNPQIKNQLLQLAAIASAEENLVSELFEATWPELVLEIGSGWLSLDRNYFRDLPKALQRRTIRRAVEFLNPDVSDLAFKTVEQAVEVANRQESGTETMLPGGMTLLYDYETLLFTRDANELPVALPQMPHQKLTDEGLQLPLPGKVALANGWVLSAKLIEEDTGMHSLQVDPWTAVIDLPHTSPLFVRPRRVGERMQPLGLDGRSKSLQDIMVNRKIAARLREKWPMVATNEHVIWLTGHIIDHRARITENPRRIVRLTCERLGEES